mmetsp:Transcript_25246/g.41067  ORF Transcript_25246/g.41067 Transcript_25246/m.41067 type:complete len:210 (+) Transcript_25246:1426-2055(+)
MARAPGTCCLGPEWLRYVHEEAPCRGCGAVRLPSHLHPHGPHPNAAAALPTTWCGAQFAGHSPLRVCEAAAGVCCCGWDPHRASHHWSCRTILRSHQCWRGHLHGRDSLQLQPLLLQLHLGLLQAPKHPRRRDLVQTTRSHCLAPPLSRLCQREAHAPPSQVSWPREVPRADPPLPRRLRSHSCAPPWPPKGRSRAAAGAEALPASSRL